MSKVSVGELVRHCVPTVYWYMGFTFKQSREQIKASSDEEANCSVVSVPQSQA